MIKKAFLMALVIGLSGMALATTTIFDVSTNSGFNDWIEDSNNLEVKNGEVVFDYNTTGNFTTQKFKVAEHDNLTVEVNGSSNGTAQITGYKDNSTENETESWIVNETMSFSISDGSNEFNTTGLDGSRFDISVTKDSTDSYLNVTRLGYTGELPDSSTLVVGGQNDGASFFGYSVNMWILGALALLVTVVLASESL